LLYIFLKTLLLVQNKTSTFAVASQAMILSTTYGNNASGSAKPQRLIVTFFKPNANIPLSNSKAEMRKAVSDSRERQPNDHIIDINPLLSLPFQEAHMITPSLSRKFIVESLSEGA
jgi:hypothetical protein